MSTADPLQPGELLEGRYRIGARLGDGAYAVVHEALGPDGRFVAVKALVRNAEVIDPSAVARFRREMKLAAELRHPNIVEVVDWGQTGDGRLFLVMERLEGHSLADVMYQEPFPETATRHVLCQVLAALRHAHERGFIHRDIKPSNVFLCSSPVPRREASSTEVRTEAGVYGLTQPLVEERVSVPSQGAEESPRDTIQNGDSFESLARIQGVRQGAAVSSHDTAEELGLWGRDLELGLAPDEGTRVKILDFGLSKGIFGKRVTFNSDLTSAGMMVGTPGYLAPEQLGDAKATTPQMDLYAVGLLGYEMLMARPAFQGVGVAAMFQQLTQEPEPPPGWIRQMDIFPVIERLMARDTEVRYRQAAEALSDLGCISAIGGHTR